MLRKALREVRALAELRRDPVAFHRSRGVRIGANASIYGSSVHTFGSEPYLVSVGDDVTISHDVDFVTHDGSLRVIRKHTPGAYYYGRIAVGDNVFVGAHSTILPGVTIGSGSVVGAGSIVTKNVPSGVVVAGVPARVLKSIDDMVEAKRSRWIDTSGLDSDAKRALLERLLPYSGTAT